MSLLSLIGPTVPVSFIGHDPLMDGIHWFLLCKAEVEMTTEQAKKINKKAMTKPNLCVGVCVCVSCSSHNIICECSKSSLNLKKSACKWIWKRLTHLPPRYTIKLSCCLRHSPEHWLWKRARNLGSVYITLLVKISVPVDKQFQAGDLIKMILVHQCSINLLICTVFRPALVHVVPG